MDHYTPQNTGEGRGRGGSRSEVKENPVNRSPERGSTDIVRTWSHESGQADRTARDPSSQYEQTRTDKDKSREKWIKTQDEKRRQSAKKWLEMQMAKEDGDSTRPHDLPSNNPQPVENPPERREGLRARLFRKVGEKLFGWG